MRIILSVNLKSKVKSKGEAGIVNYVEQILVDTSNKEEARQIFRYNVHSINHFNSKQIKKENYAGMFGLALDYDDGNPTIAEVKEQLKGFNYIFYTSSNHMTPKGDIPACERFRIILPFDPDRIPMYTKQLQGNSVYEWAKRKYPNADPMVFGMHSKLYPNTNPDENKYLFDVNEPDIWFEIPPNELEAIETELLNKELVLKRGSKVTGRSTMLAWDESIILKDKKTKKTLVYWDKMLSNGETSSESVYCPKCDDIKSENPSACIRKNDVGRLNLYCHHCSSEKSRREGKIAHMIYWADYVEPNMFFMDSSIYQVVEKKHSVFYERVAPHYFPNESCYKSTTQYLARDPERRTSSENFTVERISKIEVEKVSFNLNIPKDVLKVYNPGIAVDVEDNTYINKWLDTTFPEYSNFIKDWMALYCYENFNKMPVLVFLGPRSAGKSTFAEIIKEIFPSEGVEWKGTSENFTEYFEKKLLIIDENYESKKEQYASIKRVTGADSLRVNKKYRPPYNVRNNVKIILLTNDERPMYFSRKELPPGESMNNFFIFKFNPVDKVIGNIKQMILKRLGHYIRTALKTRYVQWKSDNLADHNRYSIPVPINDLQKQLFMSAHTSVELEGEDLAYKLVERYGRYGYVKLSEIKEFVQDMKLPGKARNYIQQLQDDKIISHSNKHREGGTGARLGYQVLMKDNSSLMGDGAIDVEIDRNTHPKSFSL